MSGVNGSVKVGNKCATTFDMRALALHFRSNGVASSSRGEQAAVLIAASINGPVPAQSPTCSVLERPMPKPQASSTHPTSFNRIHRLPFNLHVMSALASCPCPSHPLFAASPAITPPFP